MRALFLIAAFSSATAFSAESPRTAIYDPDFSCDRGSLGMRVGSSLKEFRNIRGLQSEKLGTQGVDRDHRTLTFDGAVMRVVHPKGDGSHVLIESLTIDKPRRDLTTKVGVGASLAEVSKVTGKNLVPVKSQVEICGDTDCITLLFKDDRVVRMQYSCYTG